MDWVMSNVKFFELPLAIVTIMVSPIALETARTIDATIPDMEAGITTLVVVSSLVDPSPNAPSFIMEGTAFIASSDREATIGIIIIPMTIPGLRAFFAPRDGITFIKRGVTNEYAKKPYTIVGIPAKTSSI